MLRPSSARHASTCLRCNLRLVLRQIHHRRYQSSHESPLPTQDFPASEPASASEQQQTPQPSRLRLIRTHGSHGRIRGKKGGQRRVESSEALSIASLGQSSEVIVLRDLHEPRPGKKDPNTSVQSVQHAESAEPKPPALTGRDIENMSGRRALRPRPAEVFESIDALRPDEGLHVLTDDEFRQYFAALNKGYTISQLKGYLVQKTAPVKPPSSKAKKLHRTLSESNGPGPTEISSSSHKLQNLRRTAWHAGTTSMTKRLPLVDFSMSIGRKMNNKDDVIKSILRHAWALGIEEEQAAIGEMEFLLSPMQFGLLLTKNSQTLKPLLESSKFYRNSRFQLYQAERVIRIIGPRAEAEAIAHVLTEAFAPARSADINLETFHDALQQNPSGLTLRDILTPAQLNNIMTLTRTYIHYDVDAKRLHIASFVDVAINDAHRLLIALLPLNSRIQATHLYNPHEVNDCRLEPILSTKHLPSHAKHRLLGRWVTTSPRIRQSGADPAPLDAEHHANSGEKAIENSLIPPLQSHSPIINEAVTLMKSCLNSSRKDEDGPEIESQIWPQKPTWTLWRARVGLALHDLQEKDHYPGLNGLYSSLKDPAAYPKQIFSFQVPGLLGVLASSLRHGLWTRKAHGRTELTAHLIPSPLEQTGTLASATLPAVQLRFHIEEPGRKVNDPMALSATLPDGKRIALRRMYAVMTTEAVQLILPSQPADLRFERQQRTISKFPARDLRIRSFVEAIFQSMANDTSLRAPPALHIPVPGATRGQIVHAKYLFAGFEYNESRRFDLGVLGPSYSANVQSIEAGVTGGRQLEFTLRYSGKPLDAGGNDKVVEELADASVKVMNTLAEAQIKGATHSRNTMLVKDGNVKLRTRQLSTFKSKKMSKEDKRAMYRPRVDDKQDRKLAHKLDALSRDETGRAAGEEALQTQVTNDGDLSTMEKVAKQERGVEMDTNQDPRVEEVASSGISTPETIAIEKPESQTRTFDADVEHGASSVSEQASSTETPGSTSRTSTTTIEEGTSEQMPAQASPEPETQEIKAEEPKAPEEEPLSIRLRRMMGGGA